MNMITYVGLYPLSKNQKDGQIFTIGKLVLFSTKNDKIKQQKPGLKIF